MEAEDPLSQLADIHLPTSVSFWPPAPGWWLLAVLVLLLLCWGAFRLFRRWQRHQRLASALQELDQAVNHFQQNENGNDDDKNSAGLKLLYQLNSLLKRVALVHYPHNDVASLTGKDWTLFLDSSGKHKGFTDGPGNVLADGEYRRQFDADAQALQSIVRHWIRDQYLQHSRKPLHSHVPDGTAQMPAGAEQ